jgi:hypothetical protein
MLVPFTFHWNEGVVPPFAGVAVNRTGVFAHTGFVVALTAMLTGSVEIQVPVTWTLSTAQ